MKAEIMDTQYAADVQMSLRIEDHEKADLELFLKEMNGAGKLTLTPSY